MVALVVLEMAVARQRVRRPEVSVKEADGIPGDHHGLAISLALCGRMRASQARAKAAKRPQLKIAPPNGH